MTKQLNQNQLVRIFKDIKRLNTEETRFCFLLGAGASRSSGIPTGWELAKLWYDDLKDDLDESELKKWEKDIGFNEDRIGEFYPQLYEKRYESSPQVGYDEFKKLMENKDPSIGYVILAQILAKERHNFVITTNFDFLVEDAVRMHTATKPFSAGHETLAGFVSSQTERPTIIKVHRDLFLNPFNDKKKTEALKAEWKEALKPILRNFNLLVLGYGGNDGSLMDYLCEIKPEERKPIYWCKRNKDTLTGRVRKLLQKDDFVVSIRNFDELMYALYNVLEYKTFEKLDKPEEHQLVEDAKKRITNLNNKLREILEQLKQKDLTKSNSKNAKGLFTGALDYLYKAHAEKDLDKKEKIFLEGLEKYPEDISLLNDYSLFLKQVYNDYDQAEEYFNNALRIKPTNAKVLTNTANLFWQVRKDYKRAEEYYKKALETGRDNATILSNYAGFLSEIRKDYDQAEKFYIEAIKVDSENVSSLSNYAGFLHGVRKKYDQAEEYYRKSLEIDPENVNVLGNYTYFLWSIRKDYDQAEEYYRESLKIDPDNANILDSYANFLLNVKKDYGHAKEYYRKSLEIDPENANFLGNYAHFLIIARHDFDTAREYIDKAFELQPDEFGLLAELWFYRYAHYEAFFERGEQELEKLVKNGAKSIGWNLQAHVDIAKKNNHPDIEKLQYFADKITKEE